MDSKKYDFLKAVLGQDGAAALYKAADRLSGLEEVILPRAIMAWLAVASHSKYEGNVPGVDDSYLDFAKNSDGSYSGSIAIGDRIFPFANASSFHLAASMALSLGMEEFTNELENVDLVKLGKSIDLMAKAKYVSNLEELNKAVSPKGGQQGPGQPAKSPPDQQIFKPNPKGRVKGPETGGSEQLVGKPVSGDAGFGGPIPSQPKRKPETSAKNPPTTAEIPIPKTPKNLKIPKLAQNEKHECDECGLPLIKNDKFVGCMCLRDVARFVTLSKNGGETYISFDPELDNDAVTTILETLGISHG